MLKLMQLHKRTNAAAIPKHSNATLPAASFDELYEFLELLFSFLCIIFDAYFADLIVVISDVR
jgi:hypothetical protein